MKNALRQYHVVEKLLESTLGRSMQNAYAATCDKWTLNLNWPEKYSNEVRISKCVRLGSMIVVSGRQKMH